MQAAFKYRETTAFDGHGGGTFIFTSFRCRRFEDQRVERLIKSFFFFFLETDMNCVDDNICL